MKKMFIAGLVLVTSTNPIFTAAEKTINWAASVGSHKTLDQQLLDTAKPYNKQRGKQGNCAIIETLLTQNANPDAQDAKGNTALHLAATPYCPPHLYSNERTPFWLRGKKRAQRPTTTYFTRKMMHLVLRGADYTLQNNDGKTAEQLLIDWVNSGMGDIQVHRNALNCLRQTVDLKRSLDEQDTRETRQAYRQRGLEHGFVYNR